MRLVARVEALQAFLKTDDGANLLAGYKRAANILKAEEKKDGKTYHQRGQREAAFRARREIAVRRAGQGARRHRAGPGEGRFRRGHAPDGALRGPVDAFFDKVKVNADDKQVRENRLNLLASLRDAAQVADFSRSKDSLMSWPRCRPSSARSADEFAQRIERPCSEVRP